MANKNDFQPDKKPKFGFINGKLIPHLPVRRVDYIIVLIAVLCYLTFAGFKTFSTNPAHTYNFNPVSKIVLKYKALEYVEGEYPLFAENDTVDINTGMIKHSDGYMVTCYDKDDSASKVTVYFDKKFNVTKDAANIKSAQP